MMQVNIDEIPQDYQSAYRNLVHEALVNDHECFRISPNDNLDIPFANSKKPDDFTLGAFLNKKLIGAISFRREGFNREKLRHKGVIARMIVSKNFRGQGIGKQLIAAVIERAKRTDGIEQINLTVIPTNEKAKALYEQFGFSTFASEPNAIKWNGRYFTEDQMVLKL